MKSNIFICRRLLFRYFDAPVETITDLANMWPEYDHYCRRRLYSGSILVFSIRVHTLGKWYSVSASTPLSRRYKFAFDCAHATKVDTLESDTCAHGYLHAYALFERGFEYRVQMQAEIFSDSFPLTRIENTRVTPILG